MNYMKMLERNFMNIQKVKNIDDEKKFFIKKNMEVHILGVVLYSVPFLTLKKLCFSGYIFMFLLFSFFVISFLFNWTIINIIYNAKYKKILEKIYKF